MKFTYLFSFLLFFLILGSSCNTDEGFGGSSSLEGYVYNIVHYDDNFTFRKDTIPAVKEDVFLVFGDNSLNYFGEDIETDYNGFYRFEFLRPGNYNVYAYSELADKKKIAVIKDAKVIGKTNKADTIFINTGKAYGTSIIKGNVYTTYYHNGVFRDRGPGTGMRAYIKYKGEEGYFDDVRVVEGSFYFQKILPGEYEVGVTTEDISTEAVSLVKKTISVTETGIICEIPETYQVNVSV
ncbi:MAG: hypothetical protein GX102_06930 [Porphyromonadaceae bacterium]|nr:hypothetical protein [Porphyromonadaceae bacterium]